MAQDFNLLLTLALFGGFCVGAVFLQIFLSKAKSKFTGLILPLVTFGISLFIVFGYAASTTWSSITHTENGVVISRVITSNEPHFASFFAVTLLFLLCNVPTGILLAIYFAVRNRRNKALAIQKMSVQDIE